MLKEIVKNMANALGIGLISSKALDHIKNIEQESIAQLDKLEEDRSDLMELLLKSEIFKGPSHAQLQQDIIVLLATNFKRNGFFVEFGATDGIELSNTYLLEKEYGWQGILAEPAEVWHKTLLSNRNVHIDFSCVWRKSNETLMFEVAEMAEFSTIHEFKASDRNVEFRKDSTTHEVQTISLEDLLIKYNAPREIDYLSIDTEGSEFEVLNNFDFSKYEISIITCEHNYSDSRADIFELLSRNGFSRKLTSLSKWDDWYFNKNIFNGTSSAH